MPNTHDKILLQTVNTDTEDRFIQMILLNEHAFIVESCDTLFNTQQLENKPSTEWSPFVESMFDYLVTLPSGTPEILFSRVEEPLEQLKGFYDFTFAPVEIEGQKYILWTIYDYTTLYSELQRNQQRMNDLELHRQNLNNKIHRLVHKNLSLYQKRKSKGQENSLLLQANNVLLKQVFSSLDQVTDATKNEKTNSWVNSFSLYELLNELEFGFNAIQNYPVQVISNVKKTLQLIGDKSQLLYVFYDLLSISNTTSLDDSILEIKNIPTSQPAFLTLEINIQNTRLQLLDVHNQVVRKEFSQFLTPGLAIQLETIKKLITNQSGKFEWLKMTKKGSYFKLTLPFRTT